MNIVVNSIDNVQKTFEYKILKFGFCTLLLYFIALFVNHAPHNIFITLSGLVSLVFLLSNPKKHVKNYVEDRSFFIAILAYVAFYVFFNIYHLNTLKDLMFALERVRWVSYALVIFPMVKQILEQEVYKDPDLLNFKYIFLTAALVLSSLIFIDSFSRVMYGQPSTAKWFSNLSSSYYTRASWTYNPIPFSQLSFFASVGFLLTAWKLWSQKSKLAFTLATTGVGMLAVTLFTQTRSTWLSFAVFCASLFILNERSRKKIAALTCVVLLGVVFSGESELKSRLYSITSQKKFSNVYRKEHWIANLKLAKENLLIGVGYAENRKPAVIDPYLKKFTEKKHLLHGHSHNEYLDVLSGMGLVPFVIFLFIFTYPLYKLIHSPFKNELPAAVFISFLFFMYSAAFFDLIALTSWSTLITAWYCCLLYKGSNDEDSLRM